uniref:Uncharacterized protein n=1 Tax=Pararge aegeria TaxID=116150 RepID=S4P799_9NEOP
MFEIDDRNIDVLHIIKRNNDTLNSVYKTRRKKVSLYKPASLNVSGARFGVTCQKGRNRSAKPTAKTVSSRALIIYI